MPERHRGVGEGRGGLRIAGLRSALAGPFDLRVLPGEVVAVSGASGSGKSLFLRMIADLDRNDGEVSLNGIARSARPAPDWRRQVPHVAAEPGWWADRVLDHVEPGAVAAARALATRLGIGKAQVEGPVATLSTGERQRFALVRALVLDSPVLLLDEPTGPLDPASVALVEAVLRERRDAGCIVVMASHDPHQGERLGARRYRMTERRLEPET